jgi:hypothetical protein
VHLKTFRLRLLLLLHKLPRFLPTSHGNLKRTQSISKNAHPSRCSSLPRVIVQQNFSMYIRVLAVVHPYHAYESGMQTHGERLQQAAIVDSSALQRTAADRDLLDLFYRYAQGEGRWYMDVRLWVHRAAQLHPSNTVADPSLAVPMLCFAGKEQTNSNTFNACSCPRTCSSIWLMGGRQWGYLSAKARCRLIVEAMYGVLCHRAQRNHSKRYLCQGRPKHVA